MAQLTFNKIDNNFFNEIKEKINRYFVSNHIKRTGDYKIFIKSAVFILSAVISYIMLLFFPLPVGGALAFCILLGVSLAGIGFNIMHEGAHGCYSSRKWLNEVMSYSLNLIGGNAFIWKNKHNFNHHTYTNIEGADDDIDIEPWIRTNLSQKKHWYHRYQHIYGLLLYGTTYIYWVFVNDFKKYFSKKIADTDLFPMNLRENFIFWISKIIYFSLFLIIPIFKVGLWETIIGYSIMAVVCGFIIGLVFQLAHVIEAADFPLPTEDSNKIEQNWVLHQISTTVNFAVKNKAIFWFTGGLNFQVVHHILPKVSHAHYPQINELIKETCIQYNVKYTEYPTFWSALCSHISYLKQIGRA